MLSGFDEDSSLHNISPSSSAPSLVNGTLEFTSSITPLEKHTAVPQDLIRYTGRVQCPVRYTSAESKNPLSTSNFHNNDLSSSEGISMSGCNFYCTDYPNDEYLKLIKPLSVLCLPILHDEQLLGVLYLENQHIPDAFHPRRLTMLDETILPFLAAMLKQSALLDSQFKPLAPLVKLP